MKRHKYIATLATNPSTGYMLMEIEKPQKEDKFHELTANDFHITMVDIGIHVHDSMDNI